MVWIVDGDYRITYAIVALPIALVTSWVLWERG